MAGIPSSGLRCTFSGSRKPSGYRVMEWNWSVQSADFAVRLQASCSQPAAPH